MATTEKSSKKNTESGQVFNRAISLRRRIASPQQFERALDEIRTLETLREGWDSYNAPAIAPEARSRACAFMTMLATHLGSRVSLPVIGPTPAGGVKLRWDDSNREVEVTFRRPAMPPTASSIGLVINVSISSGAALAYGVTMES